MVDTAAVAELNFQLPWQNQLLSKSNSNPLFHYFIPEGVSSVVSEYRIHIMSHAIVVSFDQLVPVLNSFITPMTGVGHGGPCPVTEFDASKAIQSMQFQRN